MRVTGLRRAHGLLVVQARIWGPLANDSVSLALDTAATETLVKPDVLRRFGYRDQDAVRRTTITSAIGVEPGHLLVVERFAALGFAVSAHLVHAHELPDQYDIDGLLGLRFLDLFDYTILSRRNEIAVELASTAST